MRQSTSNIVLVRPANLIFNTETGESNTFQNKTPLSAQDLQSQVLSEFDLFAQQLTQRGVNVMIIEGKSDTGNLDSLFPSYWGSFHADGTVILYPIQTAKGRAEKRAEILDQIKQRFIVSKVLDLTKYESEIKYLEAIGSVVFDHIHKIAYAAQSVPTDNKVLKALCDAIEYKSIGFSTADSKGQEICHTTMMMTVSESFAVICLESIKDMAEQEKVIASLEETGHEIIEITLDQFKCFAGNMLTVSTKDGAQLLVMSKGAFEVLSEEQMEAIQSYCEPFPVDISTIEKVGGRSARSMIVEVFLKERV